MESKILLVVLSLGALVAVSSALQCYTCKRLEVLDIAYGDDDYNKDKCEHPVDQKSPSEDECDWCFMDTRDSTGYEWVERGCIKNGEACTDGETQSTWPDTDWLKKLPLIESGVKFDVTRKCCKDADNCNKMGFNPDSASSLTLSFSLVLATLAAIFYNY